MKGQDTPLSPGRIKQATDSSRQANPSLAGSLPCDIQRDGAKTSAPLRAQSVSDASGVVPEDRHHSRGRTRNSAPDRKDEVLLPPTLEDVHSPVQPVRKRSKLITASNTAYRPQADSTSVEGVPSPDLAHALSAALTHDTRPPKVLDDAIDNYKFFIASHEGARISSDISVGEENGASDKQRYTACSMQPNPDNLPEQDAQPVGKEIESVAIDGGKIIGEERGVDTIPQPLEQPSKEVLPTVPEFLRCVSHYDLDDDSAGFTEVTKALQSSAFYRNVLFAFRVTVFASIPAYLLVLHPHTSNFFAVGMLVPVLAALLAQPTLGEQCRSMATCFQVAIGFTLWGVIMNAVDIIHHEILWWFTLFFILMAVCLLGDTQSKRFMMAVIVITMLFERHPKGDEIIFSLKFLRDFSIACGMSCIAALLPFPVLSRNECTEAMKQLHKLYSAAVGNAMKSYWAPIRIDGRSALTQMPFTRIDDLTSRIQELIVTIQYEISEIGLDNIFREERLKVLEGIKMHLYTMAAAASHRLDGGERAYISQDVAEFEKRVTLPAMHLADQVMNILIAMGSHLRPVDLATKIDYTSLYNKSSILADIIEREQAQMLFLKRSADRVVAREATNSYLHTLSFLSSLVNISSEIEKMENDARNFDASRYPTVWRRAFDFFIGDLWNDFWNELPKRITLATARDVRLWKDSIRYAVAFTAVNIFTIYNDPEVIYYFSVIILARFVQQTTSETLFFSIYHIFGLSIGIAISFFIKNTFYGMAEKALVSAVFVFVLLFFTQNKIYGPSIQYAAMTTLSGQGNLGEPLQVTARLIDTTFAFMLYLLICAFIFPVDPIHCLWNARCKIFIGLNDMLQSIVVLGCAPITESGLEAKFVADIARAKAREHQSLLKEYATWMPKAEAEPIIRGSEYPVFACHKLLLYMKEMSALERSVLDAMEKLHRPRDKPPSVLVLDIVELIKPFMIDASKIVHRFFQSVIDATEKPLQWSMEDALKTIWKSQLACQSLKRVTGNIQRNFFAAYKELSAEEKYRLNPYSSSSTMVSPKQGNEFFQLDSFDDETLQRLYTLSFHLSTKPLLSHEDVSAFNTIVTVFDLILRMMGRILPHMVTIHEFERSRV